MGSFCTFPSLYQCQDILVVVVIHLPIDSRSLSKLTDKLPLMRYTVVKLYSCLTELRLTELTRQLP